MNIRFLLSALLLSGMTLAHADLVLVANPATSFNSLQVSQVSRIFLGQTDQLPDGSRAVPLDVSGNAKDDFSRGILKKSPEQISKYWARMIFTGKANPPREVKMAEVKARVAETPGVISYMEKAMVDGSVKVIAVTP